MRVHSDDGPALEDAGITPTTIRIAVGDEDPRTLIAHLLRTAELTLDPVRPGFSAGFMDTASIDALYRDVYADVHRRWVESRPTLDELLR